MNKGKQKSCTGNNKIYILAKVDAYFGRHVDLISKLGPAVPTFNTTIETFRQTEDIATIVVGRLWDHSP